MGSQENSRKRSEHARRQKRDAYRRFSSAAEPVPEAGARREKKKRSTAVRAPEASARQEKRSTAVRAPEASARQEKRSAAVRAPVLSTAAAERSMRASDRREKKLRSGSGSGSGVVAKQKKTIGLTTSSGDESSSSDESAQLRPVEQLKRKEKKVSKHSVVPNMQVHLANQMMLLSMLSANVILG
jgi:hypothetical protein